ncbi:MAG TPA: hypothetical protein VGO18_31830 [Steroidobacteraceae bacterium]|nr:hypothetical protein [Steroidobacteraceae bacterium]
MDLIREPNTFMSNLGPWSGGLEYRYLGREPLSPGEPVDGTPDLHVHPLEPIAVRLTLSKTF